MIDTNQKGAEGEKLACKILSDHGYRIIERNFTCRYGEIDIIVDDPNGYLVFVEVKTYQSNDTIDPRYCITPNKRKRLIRTGKIYIAKHQIIDRDIRFDLMLIMEEKVTQYKNVILVSD